MASAATSTTLPLFWHLSSNKKDERLDASSRLISALSEFQAGHAVDVEEQPDVDVEDYEVQNARLDSLNAADVAYAIRRLIRGLASPRESSRLGFAVALTEVSLVTPFCMDRGLTFLSYCPDSTRLPVSKSSLSLKMHRRLLVACLARKNEICFSLDFSGSRQS